MDLYGLNYKNGDTRKRCHLILDNIKIIVKDDLERLSYDNEIILGMLEISLYPMENVEYSILATDFICTNIALNNIIKICIINDSLNSSFDYNNYIELDYGSQSNIDYSLNTDSDSYSYSYSESDLEMEFGFETKRAEYNEFACNVQNKNNYSEFNKDVNEPNNGTECYKNHNTGCNLNTRIKLGKHLVKKNKEYPISMLIKFITDYFDIDSCNYMNYMGMYNFCKIIYSLLLFNLDWTLINILFINENYILNNLILSVSHESVVNLLKIVIIVICEYNEINKLEAVSKKEKKLLNGNVLFYNNNSNIMINKSYINNIINILTKLLVYNLRICETEINELNCVINKNDNYFVFDSYYTNLIINKTSGFINEIINNTIDISNIVDYFKYNQICDNMDVSPLFLYNKLDRWLISMRNKNKSHNKNKNLTLCFEFILNISSKEVVNELLDILLSSIKKFIVNGRFSTGFLYYSNSFKCSLSIINSILNNGSNSLVATTMNKTNYIADNNNNSNYHVINMNIKDNNNNNTNHSNHSNNGNNNNNNNNSSNIIINNKYIKIIGNIKKLITVRHKNEIELSEKLLLEFERNKILNWKLSNNVIIPIIKTYILDIVYELYDKNNTCTNYTGTGDSNKIEIVDERRACIVTILIEFFNYIGITLINDQLESVNRLLSELDNKSKFPIIFEIFDIIIFNDTSINSNNNRNGNNIIINNSESIIIEDTVYYLFKICINNINYNRIKDIKNNISLNARLLFIYQYLNSSFIYNLSKLDSSQVKSEIGDDNYISTNSNKGYPDVKKIFNEHINKKLLDNRMLKRMENIHAKNTSKNYSGIIVSCTSNSQGYIPTKNTNNVTSTSTNISRKNVNLTNMKNNSTNLGTGATIGVTSSANINANTKRYNIPRIPNVLLNELYSIRKDIFESSNIAIIEKMFQK
ncbi:hypothetical protein FG379_002189 [Cryptosporidium bovis]|uniref:uncharacterized protein n=1 Tax=Cryptosporidium bovis TaxID=310047 RepID=UPI003519E16F|nr:hypothetical protein FG379_002189 [Cryptosporidium bovis]